VRALLCSEGLTLPHSQSLNLIHLLAPSKSRRKRFWAGGMGYWALRSGRGKLRLQAKKQGPGSRRLWQWRGDGGSKECVSVALAGEATTELTHNMGNLGYSLDTSKTTDN